jgi:hypothetical protein
MKDWENSINVWAAKINIGDYLPGNLIKICEFANRLCLRPELSLSAFYTVVSSLVTVGSKIDALDSTEFDQTQGIYTAICAVPSQKKSLLINEIATQPLRELQRKASDDLAKEMQKYQAELDDWEDDKNLPMPEKPVIRRYYINNASQAGFRSLLNRHGKKGWGIIVISDELARSYKNNLKSYNSGLTEDLLSYYDGHGKIELLKGDYDECLVSILGGIQPQVAAAYNNGTDDNGQWSRVNFINQPKSPFIIPDNPQGKLDITPLLTGFYEKISNLPKLKLRFTSEAEKYFALLNNDCEINRNQARTEALEAQWKKMPGKIARFSFLIHVVEQVSQGSSVAIFVNLDTLKKAATLAYFYFGEAQSLY